MEKVEHGPRRQHLHAVRPGFVDIFEENRQRRDVIEMFVGDEDVPHPLLPLQVGEEPDRAGVDRHLVVDEERDEKLQV